MSKTSTTDTINLIHKYAGLLKFGKYRHMVNFYEKGEMYLNTFDFFRNLEISNDGRADKNEYCSYHYSGDGIKDYILKLFPDGKENRAIELIGGKDLIELTLNNDKIPEYTHLFSLSTIDIEWALNNNYIIDPRNFAPHKDYVVSIYDIDSFVERVKNKINKMKCRAKFSFVEYVNKKEYTGEMGPFRKFDNYAFQNEYRIALYLKTDKPYKIYVGSLKDIASEPQQSNKFYSANCVIKYRIGSKTIKKQITNENSSDIKIKKIL